MIKIQETTFTFNVDEPPYLTHSLHTYPAKFPGQLPKFLLKNFSQKGETVLDPFCGSGTTLVEAKLQDINSIGVDVNGLSTLLSKVKSTPLSQNQFNIIETFLEQLNNETYSWNFNNRPEIDVKQIEGLDHWFQKNVAEELTFILEKINTILDEHIRNYLNIILSSLIVRVSNQESDTRFAAINKKIENSFTIGNFLSKASDFTKKFKTQSKLLETKASVNVYNADSRNLDFIKDESIDIIITSPPYANTYDYYLYHKFRKRWLDLDVKFAQYNEIGSRREYSSLKQNPDKWRIDLMICFKEMSRVLKENKLAFIVIGDSVINKKLIKIDEVIREFSNDVGFVFEEVTSSDLSKHSKIFNPTFSQKGKKEHLIKLKKTG